MTDRLQDAVAALVDVRRPHHAAAAQTRRRVVESLRDAERRRRRRVLTLVPLAAVLIGTSALAADAARTFFAQARPAEPSRVEIGAVAMVARALAPAPLLAADERASRAPSPEPPRPAESASPSSATNAIPPDATAPDAEPDADPTLALYRRAHEAHFGGGSPAEALALWNAYLTAAPAGTLAPEALFNRAICLFRLGRADEARAALTPFASGELGGYRQVEAERLLEALRPR